MSDLSRCWIKVGAVAYKLELPQELSRVPQYVSCFHRRKCYSDDPLVVSLEGLQVDEQSFILFENCLAINFPSLLENKSFHFDVPSSPRPPAKPPDDDEFELDTGILTVKMVDDNSEHYVFKPRILST
ncbi:hypothetical protein Tco_0743346 [Tanacetum coccineum]